MKKQLILVVSDRMGNNTKPNRNENQLVRMTLKTRNNFNLDDGVEVELWPNTSTKDRINRSKMLRVFRAFSSDVKKLKDQGMQDEDITRVGFVTKRMFDYLCPPNTDPSTHISLATTIEDTFFGSDPEFILLDGDNVPVYAGDVHGLNRDSKLGHDGPLAEIRPDPSIKVDDFVENIRDVLINDPSTEYIKNYSWLAGCHYEVDDPRADRRHWPIGGHIHVGMPLKLKDMSFTNNVVTAFGKSMFVTLVRILDEFIAVPLIKLDTKKWTIKRRNEAAYDIQPYGRYGDYRTKHMRLEYRTLSGSWLAHPELSKMVIGTIKCIVDSYYKFIEGKNFDISLLNHPNFRWDSSTFTNFDGWSEIPVTKHFECTAGSTELSAIMNDGNITFNKGYFKVLMEKFSKLSEFHLYQDHIERFVHTMALPDIELSRINRDIKVNWIENGGLGI